MAPPSGIVGIPTPYGQAFGGLGPKPADDVVIDEEEVIPPVVDPVVPPGTGDPITGIDPVTGEPAVPGVHFSTPYFTQEHFDMFSNAAEQANTGDMDPIDMSHLLQKRGDSDLYSLNHSSPYSYAFMSGGGGKNSVFLPDFRRADTGEPYTMQTMMSIIMNALSGVDESGGGGE